MKLLPSGTKDVFDIDIIAGYILAEVFIYSFYYLANKVDTSGTLNATVVPWVNWNMVASVATPLVLAFVTKGRIRKVMIYAFWFAFAMQLHYYLYASGTVKLI